MQTSPESKTLQEHFDFVVSNLLKQKARSESRDGFCRYRGENGLKCAAGWLIPDEKYRPDMDVPNEDGTSIRRLLSRYPDALPPELSSGEGLRLVVTLQLVHDQRETRYWPAAFRQVAAEFSLSPAALTRAEGK